LRSSAQQGAQKQTAAFERAVKGAHRQVVALLSMRKLTLVEVDIRQQD
jgi:hypothetical protein